jgi:hypothetical protein
VATISTINDMPVGVRGGELGDLIALLRQQKDLRHDWVVPAAKLRAVGGRIVIPEIGEPVITMDGVTPGHDADLVPTANFIGDLAGKLSIPVQYLRRCHAHGTDEMTALFDHNVNAWLDTLTGDTGLMVRAFVDGEGNGIARALVSDRYGAVDHLEYLGAVLKGFQSAGLDPLKAKVTGDITETKMYVRITHPEVFVDASEFIKGYRFHGRDAAEFPLLFAGIEVANSETGGGAASLTPRLELQVCTNGQKATNLRQRVTHVGARQSEGAVAWSEETVRRALALAASQAADAVRNWMTPGFVQSMLDEWMGQAATAVTKDKVVEVLKNAKLAEVEAEAVLDEWLRGGVETAGGVMQAVTAYAQGVPDADRMAGLEDIALELMGAAAR